MRGTSLPKFQAPPVGAAGQEVTDDGGRLSHIRRAERQLPSPCSRCRSPAGAGQLVTIARPGRSRQPAHRPSSIYEASAARASPGLEAACLPESIWDVLGVGSCPSAYGGSEGRRARPWLSGRRVGRAPRLFRFPVVTEGGVASANGLAEPDLAEALHPAVGLFRVAGDPIEQRAEQLGCA